MTASPVVDIDIYPGGIAVGAADCYAPDSKSRRIIVAFSGTVAAVKDLLTADFMQRLPPDYVIAPAELHDDYWRGRLDPRFKASQNSDRLRFPGDSTTCPEPRLYQEALRRQWKIRGMTLEWKGDAANPFPDRTDPTGRRMHHCPSCIANVKSIQARGSLLARIFAPFTARS
jgi:hypothetical protein